MKSSKKAQVLSKLFSGRSVKVGTVGPATTQDCDALHLEHGATVCFHASIGTDQTFYIYGERSIAVELLSIPEGTTVRASANIAFGTMKEVVWGEDGPLSETRIEKGLVVTQIFDADSKGI
jgi:hypothetical protein